MYLHYSSPEKTDLADVENCKPRQIIDRGYSVIANSTTEAMTNFTVPSVDVEKN
jgi:negative regulator of replication initiation